MASQVTQLLRAPFKGRICVLPAPDCDPMPKIRYRPSDENPYVVQLTARDRHWSRFTYQFSHEFCHILSDYERLRESPNGWFHEALCELASIFSLRRMAETWTSQPPFPNWSEYAGSLGSYAEEILLRKEHQLPAGITLSLWLASEETVLRKDRYLRDKNGLVACSLLPIFESESTGWNAILNMPDSSTMIKDYLLEWHMRVDPVDKPFVKRILGAFD